MLYQSADESREAQVTYHLVPAPVWKERGQQNPYLPDTFDADGLIHCTHGLEPLQQVGNMFYTSDDRDHLVLVLDMTKITSEVRYDDPDQIYPNIYGPLKSDAVIGVLAVEREPDGTFAGFSVR